MLRSFLFYDYIWTSGPEAAPLKGDGQVTTDSFKRLKAAEDKFMADQTSENLIALEKEEKIYFGFRNAKEEIWTKIPDSPRKDDARINANDTEGTSEDDLFWYQIALDTYYGNN